MTSDPGYTASLDKARHLGLDVFVLPFRRATGVAFSGGGRAYADLYGPPHTPEAALVLAHEVAHHELGHIATGWTSTPAWVWEYPANRTALDAVAPYYDEDTMYRLREICRDHVRRLMQPYIDNEIWHHADLCAALWAGCDVSGWPS